MINMNTRDEYQYMRNPKTNKIIKTSGKVASQILQDYQYEKIYNFQSQKWIFTSSPKGKNTLSNLSKYNKINGGGGSVAGVTSLAAYTPFISKANTSRQQGSAPTKPPAKNTLSQTSRTPVQKFKTTKRLEITNPSTSETPKKLFQTSVQTIPLDNKEMNVYLLIDNIRGAKMFDQTQLPQPPQPPPPQPPPPPPKNLTTYCFKNNENNYLTINVSFYVEEQNLVALIPFFPSRMPNNNDNDCSLIPFTESNPKQFDANGLISAIGLTALPEFLRNTIKEMLFALLPTINYKVFMNIALTPIADPQGFVIQTILKNTTKLIFDYLLKECTSKHFSKPQYCKNIEVIKTIAQSLVSNDSNEKIIAKIIIGEIEFLRKLKENNIIGKFVGDIKDPIRSVLSLSIMLSEKVQSYESMNRFHRSEIKST